MPATAIDQLSIVFSALADPTRRATLAEHASLISRSRSGKRHTSQLEAAPLRNAAGWIERYQRFWDSSLDRLDAHLAAVQAAGRAADATTDNDPTRPGTAGAPDHDR